MFLLSISPWFFWIHKCIIVCLCALQHCVDMYGSSVVVVTSLYHKKKAAKITLSYPTPLGSPLLGLISKQQSNLILLGDKFLFQLLLWLSKNTVVFWSKSSWNSASFVLYTHLGPFSNQSLNCIIPWVLWVHPPVFPQSVLEGYFWILRVTSVIFWK